MLVTDEMFRNTKVVYIVSDYLYIATLKYQ